MTDALNADGKMFGLEAVAARICRPDDSALVDGGRPKRVGERLVNAVRKHADGRPQNDDIAVVCFGRLETRSGPISATMPEAGCRVPAV